MPPPRLVTAWFAGQLASPSPPRRHRRRLPARRHLRALARLAGFHVHAGVGVSEDDRPFALRHGRCVAETAALAGRTARTAPGFAPASLQLAPEGPTAGTAALDPLEFLARLLTHIPDPGQVMTRYYGWYASRTRAMRRRQAAGGAAVKEPVAIADPVNWSLRAARRSSPASSFTGPAASNAPADREARPRADASPPPSPRAGHLGSPLPFRPAPTPGSGAPRRARRSPPASAPSRDPRRPRTPPTHPDPAPAHRPAVTPLRQ